MTREQVIKNIVDIIGIGSSSYLIKKITIDIGVNNITPQLKNDIEKEILNSSDKVDFYFTLNCVIIEFK